MVIDWYKRLKRGIVGLWIFNAYAVISNLPVMRIGSGPQDYTLWCCFFIFAVILYVYFKFGSKLEPRQHTVVKYNLVALFLGLMGVLVYYMLT